MKQTLTLIAGLILAGCSFEKEYTTWEVTGGTKEGIRYSSLTQVDTSNVTDLTVAWRYHTGDADTVNHSQIQCNPIMVDGILYVTSPKLKLLALDAATGVEKWRFDPFSSIDQPLGAAHFILNNNRGVTYWQNPSDRNDKRVLYCAGSLLYCINANTGKRIKSFGNNGAVDLHYGLGRDVSDLYVAATSPGIIYKNLIIMGSRVSEGSDAAPGHIRAYDVRTGEQQWIFHTIPQPGEFGHDTWDDPQAWQYIGGANSWAGFTLDEERGTLFAPIGSASFDFYGGKRLGDNLFANSLLALDAATGKRKWHYQYIHHDVWDKDLPTAPALVTIEHKGEEIDAVAQPTKNGYLFVLNRETGQPIEPIPEVSVPTDTELQGERLSATQPVPTWPVPFTRQTLTANDLNDLVSDSSYSELTARFQSYRNDGGMFTPPSLQGTIYFPGLDGGAEWGGPAFDPETQYIYINANEMPWVLFHKEINNSKRSETYQMAGERLYKKHCMTCHGANLKGSGNNPPIVNLPSRYSPEEMGQLISTGRRLMPGFQYLAINEVEAITTYVMDLQDRKNKVFVSQVRAIDDYLNLPYTITGYHKFLTTEGYPGIKPPWGSMNAIDLSTGEMVWRVPLGAYPEFEEQGIITGTENYGGPIVTKGGLVFIAATSDSKIRAFHKMTGELLWEHELPAPGFATPAMFEINGRQMLVIACGGGKLGKKSGDSYLAFALPE